MGQETIDPATARFVAKGPDAVLGYTIARLAHAVEQRFEREMASLSLTIRQFGALAHLDRDGGLGSAELGRRLLITPQSAGSLVDQLERRGLLNRDRTAGRGRIAAIKLSNHGRALLGRAYDVAAAFEAQLGEALAGDAAALNRQLLALLTRFSS